MKTFKRRFGEAYMLYKIRAGRGSVFTGELEGLQNAINKGGTLILLLSAYFHWLPPLWILPVLWAVQKAFEYFMGWLDEKKLGWWRFASEYEQRNINPWNQELMQKVDSIHNQLNDLSHYVHDVSQAERQHDAGKRTSRGTVHQKG